MLKRFIMCFMLVIFCMNVAGQGKVVKRKSTVYAVRDKSFDFLEDYEDYRIHNAPLITTDCHRWGITGMSITKQGTVLRKWCIPKENNTYVCSSPNEFIEDAQTKRRFYITKSQIGIGLENKVFLNNSEHFGFAETYPPLPSSVKVINIYNGSQYIVKNLRIR